MWGRVGFYFEAGLNIEGKYKEERAKDENISKSPTGFIIFSSANKQRKKAITLVDLPIKT